MSAIQAPIQSTALLAYCRAGFEPECAQELDAYASSRLRPGFAQTERGSALVRFALAHGASIECPHWRDLIFARQCLALLGEFDALDAKDRLGPVLDGVERTRERYADVWVEVPDSDAGAARRGLARSLEAAALAAARKRGLIDPRATRRLHLCLLGATHMLVASAAIATTAPWPMGIPRLKLPKDAPSRSALKIEEAWLTLMDERERERWLKPGASAVDLGAAPGGWTWQLARKSIRVIAVDNGQLQQHVLDTGVVTHVRADGFRYRPKRSVDWVVCDMVEQPSRIVALMSEWLSQRHARAALFNLKLPMKKRWQETRSCLDALDESLQAGGGRWSIRARQLYHDREEITVVVLPAG
jgi:23S rRNA (cytidine2498-2'-O)-methyltransferase